MISPYARQSGMLDHITLTVESGGIGGFANITARGLKLLEVYPGVDMQRDILDLLPFDVELPEGSPL